MTGPIATVPADVPLAADGTPASMAAMSGPSDENGGYTATSLTGKLTGTLVALGADVIAVEPDPAMLTELRRAGRLRAA